MVGLLIVTWLAGSLVVARIFGEVAGAAEDLPAPQDDRASQVGV
jgi:hypothetical protein